MHIKTCTNEDFEFYMSFICMLNSQIILPLFVNHQQRGKSKSKTINFSPPFCSKQRINKGSKNNKNNVLPFLSKTKTISIRGCNQLRYQFKYMSKIVS